MKTVLCVLIPASLLLAGCGGDETKTSMTPVTLTASQQRAVSRFPIDARAVCLSYDDLMAGELGNADQASAKYQKAITPYIESVDDYVALLRSSPDAKTPTGTVRDSAVDFVSDTTLDCDPLKEDRVKVELVLRNLPQP